MRVVDLNIHRTAVERFVVGALCDITRNTRHMPLKLIAELRICRQQGSARKRVLFGVGIAVRFLRCVADQNHFGTAPLMRIIHAVSGLTF